MKRTGRILWRMRTGRQKYKKTAEINREKHGNVTLLKRYGVSVHTVMIRTGITTDGGGLSRKHAAKKDIAPDYELKMIWGSIITVSLYECRRLVIWGYDAAPGKRD